MCSRQGQDDAARLLMMGDEVEYDSVLPAPLRGWEGREVVIACFPAFPT
jgi:hypothetical protein